MGKIVRGFTRLLSSRVKDHASFNVAKLSHPEVESYLKNNEFSYAIKEKCAVKSYVTNQLAANEPLEDTRAEAKLLHTKGMLFGVFDGHGGASCARILAKRLFNYIALPLLPKEQINQFVKEHDGMNKLVEPINDLFEWSENREGSYDRNLRKWGIEIGKSSATMSVSASLKKGFEKLDADIGKAAEEDDGRTGLSLGVAMSGAVACVAAVSGLELYIASAGDCQAVMGQQTSPNGPWIAKKITVEHTCENEHEVGRIKNEHPIGEKQRIIQEGRLFQSLVPLRAFGDYRYKWSVEQLEKLAVPKYGRAVVPPNYNSPPYLTASPDITSVNLSERDKFLVIATDGLWDMLSPQMVVQLVADHMSGKPSELRLQLHNFKDLFRGDASQELKPVDINGATHLIRAALGGDHEVVAKQLSFPKEHVRIIRDDITVTVIYFDTEYIKTTLKQQPEITQTNIIHSLPESTEPRGILGKIKVIPKKIPQHKETIVIKGNVKDAENKIIWNVPDKVDKTEKAKNERKIREGIDKLHFSKPVEKGTWETVTINGKSSLKQVKVPAKKTPLTEKPLAKMVWEEIDAKDVPDFDLEEVLESGGMKFKDAVSSRHNLPKTKGNFDVATPPKGKKVEEFKTLQILSLKPKFCSIDTDEDDGLGQKEAESGKSQDVKD